MVRALTEKVDDMQECVNNVSKDRIIKLNGKEMRIRNTVSEMNVFDGFTSQWTLKN